MGKSVDYPEPPDPRETAQAQGQLNKETAAYERQGNLVNQAGPFGSLTYRRAEPEQRFDEDMFNAFQTAFERGNRQQAPDRDDPRFYEEVPNTITRFDQETYDEYMDAWRKGNRQNKPDPNDPRFTTQIPGADRYEAVIELSPQQQQLQDQNFDIQTQMLDVGQEQIGRVGEALGQPVSFDGLPATAYEIPDYAADRQRVEQALMERMQPYLDRRQEQQRTRLANQGFSDRASEGYREAMDNVYRSENDARLAAIGAAGQEQSRLMQQAQAQNAAQNAARQQGIQERLTQRQTPINEIGALLSGGQVSLPQFVNAPQASIAAPDYQGAVYANYQAQVDRANTEARQGNAFAQGLFGLGGSALGALPGFF